MVRERLVGAPWAPLFHRQGYTLEMRTSPPSGGTSAWSLNSATFTGVWSGSSKTPKKTILWLASPRYFTGESWNRKHRSQVFMWMAQLICWVDAIWWSKSGSTLAYITAYCLTVQSNYLNQCWLFMTEVNWHCPECNFTRIYWIIQIRSESD